MVTFDLINYISVHNCDRQAVSQSYVYDCLLTNGAHPVVGTSLIFITLRTLVTMYLKYVWSLYYFLFLRDEMLACCVT